MATQRGRAHFALRSQLAKGVLATAVLGGGAVGVSTLAFSAPASAKDAGVARVVTIKTEHVAKLGTVLASSSGALSLHR
jgi:hypothetical protein